MNKSNRNDFVKDSRENKDKIVIIEGGIWMN